MQKRHQTDHDNRGFTLIELLIAMAVGGMVMFATYKIYVAHQRTYTAQLAVTEMQQNMRVAIDLLSSDIRMAGYSDNNNVAGAGIVEARPDLFSFTADLNEDGDIDDAGENIAYDNYISAGNPVLGRITSKDPITYTANANGHWDVDHREILGPDPPAHQPAAENVEHLRFLYRDNTGAQLAFPIADVSEIRSVQVDVVVRTEREDPDFLNTQTYTAADGTIFGGAAKNDGFRRRQQTFTVECRNANN